MPLMSYYMCIYNILGATENYVYDPARKGALEPIGFCGILLRLAHVIQMIWPLMIKKGIANKADPIPL